MGLGTPARGNKKRYDGFEDRIYPLTLPLRYRVYGGGASPDSEIRETGSGETLNISSGGVLFESDRPLHAGLDAELSIAWPASLNKSVGLTLWVWGRIVRVDQSCVELTMTRYEFRIRQLPAASEREIPEEERAVR